MGNEMRRVISFILALTMAFTSFDVSVWANEDENDIEIVNEVIETDIEDGIVESETEESSQEVDSTENIILSGTWGNNITWTLIPNEEDDSTYTLTLSGSGKIPSNYYVTVPWNDYKDSIGKVVIESGITSVGEYTFRESSNLTEVELPEGLTGIGQYSFYNCRALKKMVIPSSVTSIGNDAFSGCAFTTVGPIGGGYDFEFGCTEVIPAYAFYGNENLVEVMIPEGTKLIGDYAFAYCTSLKKIRIPSSVESVGDAFSGCVFETAGPIGGGYDFEFGWTEEIPAYAFSSAYNLTEVKIPEGITRIGRNAFNYCEALKKISVPGSVKTAAEAFSGCVFETAGPIGGGYDFEFGWTEEIPNRSFVGCEFLSTVTIPEGLEKIGDYAFEYCNSLTEVTIAEGVKEIGNHAFEDCNSLTEVTIAEGLEKIGDYAFLGCDNLVEVNMSKGLQKIGNYAFSDCISLREIDIPEGVKELGEYAFANSYGVSHYYKIRIPESVQKIGRGALGTYSLGNIKTIGPIGGDYDYEFGWTKEFPENAFGNAGDVIGVEKIYIPKTIKYSSYCFPSSDIILGSVGSYAEAHAKLCQISFQAIDEFDVQFETYTEEKVKTQARFVGIKVIEPAILERVGYAFGGWYTSAEIMDDTTKWDFENDVVSQNMTLYAKWTPNACKVSYDLGYEAADVIEAKDVIYDTAYGELPAVVREGYTFLGWYTAKENGTLLTAESIVETTENHTLYAQWKVNQYKVTFDANEGVLEVTEKEVTYGEKYGDLPVPTRKGYTFMGWATELSGGTTVNADTVVQFLSDQTLYAQWKPNKTYEVLLDANGGTVEVEKLTVTFAVEYGELPTPVKKGHTFNGWRLEDGSIVSSKSIVGVDSNHTLLAGWLENPYIVFFESGDGVVEKTSEVVYYNTAYGKLPTPVLEGHTFVGWYTAKKDGVLVTSESIVEVAEHHTLYAKYEPNVYKIIFDTNGGLVSVEEKEVLYNELYGELPVPTREGYIFLGWYTANEDGTEITADQTVKVLTDQTLYAQWEIGKYEVTFDTNGGKIENEKIIVTYHSSYGELPVPTVKGGLFLGWYTEDGALVDAESIVEIGANHTLYAQWYFKYATANPVASIESGIEVDAGTRLYLTTETNGAFIYFTMNEEIGAKVSDENGILYEDAITIVDNVTIYAIAVKPGFERSEVISISYTVHDESEDWGDITEADIAELSELGITSPEEVPQGLWIAGISDCDYIGSAITYSELHVYSYKTLLEENVDYTVKYRNNTKAGTATVAITGKGNYTGTIEKSFIIRPLDLNNASVVDVTLPYNGKVQKATTTVTYVVNGKVMTLKSGSDFTYAYPGTDKKADDYDADAFVVAGNHTVILTGKGNYIGTTTFTETITEKYIIGKMKLTKIKDQPYNKGKSIEPKIELKNGNQKLVVCTEETCTGMCGADVAVKYENNKEVGIATVTLIGVGEYADAGKYVGTMTTTFKITGTPLSKMKLNNFSSSLEWKEGGVIQEEAYFSYVVGGGADLTEGEDYTVAYQKNEEVGTATVIYTGMGGYTGTVKKTYKITGFSMSKAVVEGIQSSVTYNGEDAELSGYKLSYVSEKGAIPQELIEGKHFKVSYKNNGKAGTANIIFTGINEYTGTLKKSFKVIPYNFESEGARISVSDISDALYTKGGTTPKPEVIYYSEDGTPIMLVEGKDYTLKYQNNKAIANATANKVPRMTVIGKGNFTGKLTQTFTIKESDLSGVCMTATNVVYQNKGGLGKTAVTLLDTNGKKLVAGTDYQKTIEYTYAKDVEITHIVNKQIVYETREENDAVEKDDIIPIGAEIKATVKGMKNYTGEQYVIFRVVAADISKATVKVTEQAYTGKAIEPTKDDITVKIGKETLKKTDYEIVSYSNNVKKGTAKVTIRGIGNYGGEKTVTFKINSKKIK